MPQQIGKLNERVIDLLELSATPNSPILIGQTNIDHIKKKHLNDYLKYKNYISDILEKPDYIRQNPKDNSLEYVKEFQMNCEYVKVAVRVSNSKQWFVRSMYVLNSKRVENYIKKGNLLKY